MRKPNLVFIKGYLFSLVIAIVTYAFYMLIINHGEKYFTIPLEIKYPPQLATSTTIAPTVNITLKGNPATLARVQREDMSAEINLFDELEPGEITSPVILKRQGGFAQIKSFEVEIVPNQISLTLEPRIIREMTIDPSFIHSLPKGYLFEDYNISPSRVSVSGPESIVQNLDSIFTEDIDLSSLTYSSSRIVRLNIPEFISLESLNTQEVRIYMQVNEVILVNTYNKLIININQLAQNLRVANSLPRVDLVITGPQLVFNQYTPEAFIDVSSVQSEGTYTFEVQTVLPDRLEAVSITPQRVTLEIASINTSPTNTQENTGESNVPLSLPTINEAEPESTPVPSQIPSLSPEQDLQ